MGKRIVNAMICGFLCICLCGCSIERRPVEKLRDLDYTVVSVETVPEMCQTMIEQKKDAPFSFVYKEGDYMYLCEGYGRQETSGYSISVNELYLTKAAIYMDATLHGPSVEEIREATYPFIILKLESMDENVVFQ